MVELKRRPEDEADAPTTHNKRARDDDASALTAAALRQASDPGARTALTRAVTQTPGKAVAWAEV